MGALARAYLAERQSRGVRAQSHVTVAGDLLDRARGRDPAEGSADPDGGRTGGRWRSPSRTVRHAGCCGCARWLGCSGSCCWCCRGSSQSCCAPATAFLQQSVGQDLLAKVFKGQETHGAPPGYYLALFWLTFWPAATLAAMAVPGVWVTAASRDAKFLLAWIVPAWIVLELVVTKLPHYVLPLYPAIAILIAGVIDATFSRGSAG